jgi:hypothetical protein
LPVGSTNSARKVISVRASLPRQLDRGEQMALILVHATIQAPFARFTSSL